MASHTGRGNEVRRGTNQQVGKIVDDGETPDIENVEEDNGFRTTPPSTSTDHTPAHKPHARNASSRSTGTASFHTPATSRGTEDFADLEEVGLDSVSVCNVR